MRAREELNGWLFASPWLVGFVVFTLGPMMASLFLSLNKYTVGTSPEWVGLDNFARAILGKDDLFWPSLGRTVRYATVMVPIGITLSLLVAMLLNQPMRGKILFRTLFFLPSLTPVVASAVIWRWLYQPEFGAINWLLWELGIEGPKWLGSPDWALPSLMVIGLWGTVGGGTMIIFLAGLQGVPQELQDAAAIDGANAVQRFLHVTLPLITPTIFFNLVMGIIGTFQVFNQAYIMTQGGPGRATYFYVYYLYRNSFDYYRMGYGSAMAWFLFAIILILTLLNFSLSHKWVFYEAEEGR